MNIMSMNFLKNPIVLAVLAAGITYGYLYWQNKKAQEENLSETVDQVSFVGPLIVGLIVFIIAYNIFGPTTTVAEIPLPEPVDAKPLSITMNPVDRITDTFDSNTYHIIDRGSIKLPHTDVFIDIAKF